ncbi:MAG: hypothetical protein R3F11_20805 [Verrucomicrobiales bacterium]
MKGWFSGNRIKLPPNNGLVTPGMDDPRSQYHEDFITYGGAATRATFEVSSAFGSGEFAVPVQAQPAGEQSVKADVGASLWRDDLDNALLGNNVYVGEYELRQGGLINNPSDVGGWPSLSTEEAPTDSDRDGIPDDEEPGRLSGRDPKWENDPRNAQLDDEGDGWTNLERYLTEIVGE